MIFPWLMVKMMPKIWNEISETLISPRQQATFPLCSVVCVWSPHWPEPNSSAVQTRSPLILGRWALPQTQSPQANIQPWRTCRQGSKVEWKPETQHTISLLLRQLLSFYPENCYMHLKRWSVILLILGFRKWKPAKGIAMETTYQHNHLTTNSDNHKHTVRADAGIRVLILHRQSSTHREEKRALKLVDSVWKCYRAETEQPPEHKESKFDTCGSLWPQRHNSHTDLDNKFKDISGTFQALFGLQTAMFWGNAVQWKMFTHENRRYGWRELWFQPTLNRRCHIKMNFYLHFWVGGIF